MGGAWQKLVESRGILTPAVLVSYHLFSYMHETRMHTGDFYDLSVFNCLAYFNRLGSYFGPKQTPKTPNPNFELTNRILWYFRRKSARAEGVSP